MMALVRTARRLWNVVRALGMIMFDRPTRRGIPWRYVRTRVVHNFDLAFRVTSIILVMVALPLGALLPTARGVIFIGLMPWFVSMMVSWGERSRFRTIGRGRTP